MTKRCSQQYCNPLLSKTYIALLSQQLISSREFEKKCSYCTYYTRIERAALFKWWRILQQQREIRDSIEYPPRESVHTHTHTRGSILRSQRVILYICSSGQTPILAQLCSRGLRVCVKYKHIRPCFYGLPGFSMQPTVTTEHSKRGQRRVVIII